MASCNLPARLRSTFLTSSTHPASTISKLLCAPASTAPTRLIPLSLRPLMPSEHPWLALTML